MRDFFLNAEEQLDRAAYDFLREHGEEYGLFPCAGVHYNNRIKLACFTGECQPLSELLPSLTLDEICDISKAILRRIKALELCDSISLENAIWDQDSIYLDGKRHVYLICLPAVIPEETRNSQIYAKRVYALLQESISQKEGGDMVCRQILHQQEKNFENWDSLENVLDRRTPEEDESLVLKSINTPEMLTFRVRHEVFRIGTDPAEVDGLLRELESISPVHAEIGWNEISFYVRDLDSESGTFVNNQRIRPGMEVPIGEGTVLRFGEYTFNVE